MVEVDGDLLVHVSTTVCSGCFGCNRFLTPLLLSHRSCTLHIQKGFAPGRTETPPAEGPKINLILCNDAARIQKPYRQIHKNQ